MHQKEPGHKARHQASQAGIEQRMVELEQQFRRFRKLVFHSVGGFLAGIVLFFTTSYLMAAAPPIVYSGYLEENGMALSGNRKAELTLWTDATSTDAATHRKCQQAINAQAFVKGRFKIPLDAACTKATHDNANLWVQLTIWDAAGATSKELARTQLGTVPHAIRGTIQFGTKSYTTNALFVGVTAKQFKAADVKGWTGAKTECEAQYGPTAHMCTSEELLRSLQMGALTASHLGTSTTYWFASSLDKYYTFTNGKTYFGGSCDGWTTSGTGELLGARIEVDSASGGIRFRTSSCDSPTKLVCCR